MALDLSLHYRQSRAMLSTATEILYGGAAGGGKSHLMRVASITWAAEIKGLQVYLFRRVSDDLHKNHMEGVGAYPDLLAEWIENKYVKWDSVKNVWKFWNGSRIFLCHCQYEKDALKYQGAQIGVLMVDEATHFTPSQYRFIRGRVRLGGTRIPEKYKGLFPRILLGSNPGGESHGYFKKEFVDLAPPMTITKMGKQDGGMLRQYIPAKIADNPTLLENDPEYEDRLQALGDPALVRAMLEGDWNIVAGGALDDVWSTRLIVPRFKVPASWRIDRTFDWGSTHPFSVGWWAEANGEEVTLPNGETFCPKKGSLIRLWEWYGANDIYENVGIRIGPRAIADGILEHEAALTKAGYIKTTPKAGAADGQIYAKMDDETDTIAKRMEKRKVKWKRGDKSQGSRVNGLQLLRDRMKAVKDQSDDPGIYFMDCCRASISLLPILPRDKVKPEDVDTNALDHCYDDIRYKCLDVAKEWATSIKTRYPS